MKKFLILISTISLLASCGEKKEYDYADQLIDLYEECIDELEDAEDLKELEDVNQKFQNQLKNIEGEQKESQEALIHDMESMEETAFLRHLDILYQESHFRWLQAKKKIEIEQSKK